MPTSQAVVLGSLYVTFRRGTTEKRPRKLTTKINPIIHPNAGFLISFALVSSADCLATTSLIPKR